MKTTHEVDPNKSVILGALKHIKDHQLKVGWVADKKYPDSSMTTAGVGYIAEHGSLKRNIPPRPIMVPTNEKQLPRWKRIIRNEVKQILDGKQTNKNALERFGAIVASDYRRKITEIFEPPLKSRTIKDRVRQLNEDRKNKLKSEDITVSFTKPLIFRKIFINSLSHSVEKNDTR